LSADAKRTRLTAVACGIAALAAGAWVVAVSWPAPGPAWWLVIPSLVAGAVMIALGMAAWVRLPSPRIGQLVVLCGVCYYLQFLYGSRGLLFAAGFCLAYTWAAVSGHIFVTWPSGQFSSRFDQIFVAFAYLVAIGSQIIRYLADKPKPPWGGFGISHPATVMGMAGSAAGAGIGAVGLVIVARRWMRSSPVRRRPSWPVWLALSLAGGVKLAEATASAVNAPFWLPADLSALFPIMFIALVPLLFLTRWLTAKVAHSGVSGLLAELERDDDLITDPSTLQHALGRALGDPSLTIAYPSDTGDYVNIRGQPVTIPPDVGDRSVTRVSRRGQLVAVISHDTALDEQKEITSAALAAAGLAIENARLHANQQAQLDQLATSRLRLAQTAFDERLRIQRDLHDGAQQRFVGVLVLLDTARRALARDSATAPDAAGVVSAAHRELTDALRGLRELVQGIYPAILIEHGLAAAVENLADCAPIPVTFSVTGQRWPKHAEITTYFVISEALANTYKHAGASRATVRVHADNSQLLAEVTDDGCGGATPGDGLTGLRHRLDAVGGTLRIISEPGRGTSLTATIPAQPPHQPSPNGG
jgi:signal transduction histidine kinase